LVDVEEFAEFVQLVEIYDRYRGIELGRPERQQSRFCSSYDWRSARQYDGWTEQHRQARLR